jgi:PAS domain S-box-containing protein
MERYREELTRIRNLLRAHPRGLTVTEIARHIGVNRNSVAKYLDVLITAGHVEKEAVGSAKVYFLSPGVPVTAMLNLSSDYIIMLDEKRKIWYVNNSLLSFEGRTREEVLGRDLDEVSLILLQDPEIRGQLFRGVREGEFSTEMQVKKGEEMYYFRATLVCTLLENGSRGTTIILQDITEEKRHEESLRASEARYRAVVESQTEFVCRFLPDGTHIFVNEAYCNYFGKRRDEIEGHIFRPEIPDEDREPLRKHFRGLSRNSPVGTIEHRIVMPDGTIRWQRWSDRAIFDEEGRLTEYQSVGRDITDRRASDERLRESEEKFRGLAERSFDIILLIDEDGRITYASPALRQSLGYDPEEVIGKPYLEFIPPVDLPRATMSFERVRQGLPPQGLEIEVKRKDGSLATLELRTTPITKEGRFAGMQLVCRDITVRKASEEALRRSEEKIRSLFEASADGICLVDEGGIIVEANSAVEEISGILREEALGRPIWEIAHRMLVPEYPTPNFLEMMRSDVQQLLGTGRSPHLLDIDEHPIQRPDGTRRMIQVRNFLIPHEKRYRMGSIIQDITFRKKMEKDLRNSVRDLGERVKELQCLYSVSSLLSRDDLPLGSILKGVVDTIPSGMQVPPSCSARIRLEGQEWQSSGFSETPWVLSQEIMGAGGPPGSIDVYYASDVSGSEVPLFLHEEKRLLAEVAQRLTEAREHHRTDEVRSRLASIVECADDAIIGKDLNGAIVSWNRGAERIYGYGADEVMGKHISILLPPGYPDDIPSILEKIRSGERLEYYETQRMRKDGQVFPVSLKVSPVKNAGGGITGVSTIARDISDERQMRAALTEQMHLVRELLNRIPVPVFYKDAEGIYLGCNRAFEQLSGLSNDQIIGHKVSDLWRPEMSDRYSRIDRQILATGEVHHDEVEFPGKGEGSRSYIFTRAPFYMADGSIRGIVGTMTEITHLRKAEQALKKSEEQFREMAENSPFPIAIIDEGGMYHYINRKFTDVFGYTLDDVPDGKRWFELAYPDPGERARVISAWKTDLSNFGPGMVRPRQFRVRHRNGEAREILFRPVTMRDGSQFVTYEDVTDRIHALESLTMSESRYQHLFNTMRCCFILMEPVLDATGMPVDLSIIEANEALEHLTGRPREVLIGQQLKDIYPRTPNEFIEAVASVALKGDPRKFAIYHPDLGRDLRVRAYSPVKGQVALIFRAGDPPVNQVEP